MKFKTLFMREVLAVDIIESTSVGEFSGLVELDGQSFTFGLERVKNRKEIILPNKYSKTKLEKFKKAIEKKMGSASDEIETIKEGIGSASNKQGGVTPDSIFSVHMADAGTDSHEQEKNFMLMNRGSDY